MGYTVKNLINSNKFPGLQLISDNSGINREIRGVQIIAMPDMEKFLGGGELLLTSLMVYEKLDERMMLSHLEELNKKQVSGFVVKRIQNTAHQNKLFETLLLFCNEHSIPVLEIPQDFSYWSIIKYLLLQIFNIEIAKAVYSKMTRDEFNRLFPEETSEYRSLEKLFDRTGMILSNPIALYDEDFHYMYSSISGESDFIIADDYEKYVPNIISRYEYMRQKRKNVEYIRKINILNQCTYYLVVSEVNEPLRELDFITLDSLMPLLLYILTQIVTDKNMEKKYHRDLEYRLLNGSLSESEEDDVANLLKLGVTEDYRVITCYLKPENYKDNFTAFQRKKMEDIEKAILDIVPKECAYCNINQVICIHKENRKEGKQDLRKKLEEFQRIIQDQLKEEKTKYEFLIGVGNKVKGYHNLKESFADSKIAIEYIDVVRKIVGDINKTVVDCSKLGFFYIFANIKDKKKLITYIPDTVHEIHQYDIQKNGELIDTLECYLNHKQSIRKTSELMGVHARTVSYRLQKIVKLTGMDFDNIAEMLAVRNGIIILKILELL
ncbi:PucR family transcriptional regulator [Anaerobutyricum hallii]|jgi:sugar diacid utilization regulator|uniref:PucR family transcriptional regulator n=2 Tax=Anaerobutyricum hallii TaxID=39488 RepID=A0A414B6S6_9FIRM|nr:PucR family transcriptional regulator [Anaerobutyricum hallii]RHC66099.1 PucR family transcriptional regulator [Anaerobutyricum hallii]